MKKEIGVFLRRFAQYCQFQGFIKWTISSPDLYEASTQNIIHHKVIDTRCELIHDFIMVLGRKFARKQLKAIRYKIKYYGYQSCWLTLRSQRSRRFKYMAINHDATITCYIHHLHLLFKFIIYINILTFWSTEYLLLPPRDLHQCSF